MRAGRGGVIAAVVLAIGCADDKDSAAPEPLACWDDLEPGSTAPVATGFADGTEGLTFVAGRLFVGTDTTVVEITPDGTVSTLWENDHVLGIAAAGDQLLVADPGEFSMGGDADGQVWTLTLDGQATLLADGLSNPNFLAMAPWGEILMADDTAREVVAIDPSGAVRSWLTVESPNGIGLSPDGSQAYVASTFVPDGAVWTAEISAENAGTPTLLGNTAAGAANDGLAVRADGSVWVAANLAGQIWRFPAADDTESAAGAFASGLQTPASLAFGVAPDWDPCSIYYTELFGTSVQRLAVGP